MEPETKTALLNRLKSIAGHVQGIAGMVEEERYCIDIIKQVQAAQAALAKANQILLESHLHSCVVTAVRGDNPEDRERALDELGEVFAHKDR